MNLYIYIYIYLYILYLCIPKQLYEILNTVFVYVEPIIDMHSEMFSLLKDEMSVDGNIGCILLKFSSRFDLYVKHIDDFDNIIEKLSYVSRKPQVKSILESYRTNPGNVR